MGQTPPKMFAQPMAFGASQANNQVQQSQPVAQAPQPQTPYLPLNQGYSQTQQAPQSPLGSAAHTPLSQQQLMQKYGWGGGLLRSWKGIDE